MSHKVQHNSRIPNVMKNSSVAFLILGPKNMANVIGKRLQFGCAGAKKATAPFHAQCLLTLPDCAGEGTPT
jgi:hypothetical protein